MQLNVLCARLKTSVCLTGDAFTSASCVQRGFKLGSCFQLGPFEFSETPGGREEEPPQLSRPACKSPQRVCRDVGLCRGNMLRSSEVCTKTQPLGLRWSFHGSDSIVQHIPHTWEDSAVKLLLLSSSARARVQNSHRAPPVLSRMRCGLAKQSVPSRMLYLELL